MLRRQVGESEGEVQVLLGQLAVQGKLAVSSSKELTQLHDLIRKHENQLRLVSTPAVVLHTSFWSSQVSMCKEHDVFTWLACTRHHGWFQLCGSRETIVFEGTLHARVTIFDGMQCVPSCCVKNEILLEKV